MTINDQTRLVSKYILDRKGVRIDINEARVLTNQRQQQLLNQAFKIAVEYYNGTTIIV
jgi:hypothetical protein